MSKVSYLNISNDSHIAILGRDKSQLLMFRKKLQDLGFKRFSEFERGTDLIQMLQSKDADLLYIVDSPRDMAWTTFIRSFRTGGAFSATTAVLVLDPQVRLGIAEQDLLKAYNVELLRCQLSNEKAIAESITTAFSKRADSKSFEARLVAAKNLMRTGLTTKALTVYQQLLQEHATSIVARYGLMMASTQDSESYWDQLRSLLSQDPQNYHFKFEMISRYLKEGQLQRAKEALESLMTQLGQATEAFWMNELGVICVGMRFFALALKLAEALREKVDAFSAWQPDLLVSRAYMAAGKATEAEKYLGAAKAAAKQKFPEIENLSAVIARRSGDYETALKCFLSAQALTPEDHRIAFNTALCYERLGDIENAVRCARLAVQLCPSYGRAVKLYEKLTRKTAVKDGSP